MDAIDLKIILFLICNSRIPYREIGEHLGLSVNAVFKRIQKLVELKTIESFKAQMNPYAINAIYILVYGQSSHENPSKIPEILQRNESTSHIMVSSRNFFYIGAYLKNIHELDNYINFIKESAKMETLEYGFLNGVYYSSPIRYIVPMSRNFKLDELDISIIRSMHHDSRKSISDIAKEIKSTPATVKRRLNRLIKEGNIELSINFNPESVGDIFNLVKIKLKKHELVEDYAQKIIEELEPNVFIVWKFSNKPQEIITWIWAENMKEMNRCIERLRTNEVENVSADIIIKGIFCETWCGKMLYKK